MADHLANVRKYDPDASEEVVDKIRKHCGIALQNRDSATVATSDKAEVERVITGFCTKKLELSPEEAEKAVAATTADMASERAKDRVAFYYLIAKHAGKLEVFA
ncbi:MAG: DUF2853 family protein [Planctomycetota bacterium]